MEAKLVVNGVEMKLGHGPLAAISDIIVDYPDSQDINHELAQHPSSNVRQVVANGEELADKTIKLLLKDNCLDVLRVIVSNDSATSDIMTKRDINRMISKKDSRLLANLIEYMGDYDQDSREVIAEKLVDHPDPVVRYMLVETSNTPKKFLKQLTKDPDVDIAYQAQERLDLDFDPVN